MRGGISPAGGLDPTRMATKPKRKTGSHVAKHDVGVGYPPMTTRQIAERIGCDPHIIRARINKGWMGADLLAPIGTRRRIGVARTQTQVVALKLALTFGRKIPTPAQIRAVHPMEYAAALYWRNAIKRALKDLKA